MKNKINIDKDCKNVAYFRNKIIKNEIESLLKSSCELVKNVSISFENLKLPSNKSLQ